MSNITDAVVGNVISAIESYSSTYFSGLSVPLLKKTKKGLPNLGWLSPSVYVLADKTTKIGKDEYRIAINAVYLCKATDPELAAQTVVRSADAIGQLLEDKFSTTKLEYSFEYGVTDGASEAAAQISAEVIV